jgi:hypothetical protein
MLMRKLADALHERPCSASLATRLACYIWHLVFSNSNACDSAARTRDGSSCLLSL